MPKAKTMTSAPPDPEPDQEKQARLSFALNDDGSIDFSAMRPSTRDKLKAAIASSPGLRPEGEGPTPEEEKFPREFVPPIWDSVAVLTRTVGKIFFQWPADLTKGIQFSKEEKEKLTEPTAKMIDKYGANMKKWAVEINFLNAVAANVGNMATRAVQDFIESQRTTINVEPNSPAERPPAPVNGHDTETVRQL